MADYLRSVRTVCGVMLAFIGGLIGRALSRIAPKPTDWLASLFRPQTPHSDTRCNKPVSCPVMENNPPSRKLPPLTSRSIKTPLKVSGKVTPKLDSPRRQHGTYSTNPVLRKLHKNLKSRFSDEFSLSSEETAKLSRQDDSSSSSSGSPGLTNRENDFKRDSSLQTPPRERNPLRFISTPGPGNSNSAIETFLKGPGLPAIDTSFISNHSRKTDSSNSNGMSGSSLSMGRLAADREGSLGLDDSRKSF